MRIRWTQPAAADLTNICDYIEEHDTPATASRVASAIYESIGTLVRFPRRGRPGRCGDTRELVIPRLPYIAVYRIREDVIEIARILHGAQNWPKEPTWLRNRLVSVDVPGASTAGTTPLLCLIWPKIYAAKPMVDCVAKF